MPEPQTIVKVIDQVPHTWIREPDADGVVRRRGHWQPMAADPQDFHRNAEAFKQALTIGGGVLGGMGAGALLPEAATAVGASRFLPVATRILGSAFGGSLGRMGGHVPEAGVERFTGRPSGSTFAGDAKIGAAEGAFNEALPIAFEPVTSTAGTVLKWLGRMGLDNPAASAASRALMAQRRGWLTAPISYLMGGPKGVALETAATLGPVVASQAGQGLERLAPKLGTGTLSERLEGPLKALWDRFGFAPTRGEQLAAGAENFAANAEPWRPPKPYPAPRADIRTRTNPTGFTDVDPALAAERGSADILGERARGVGNVGVTPPVPPPPPRTNFTWDEWKRHGPAGIETPIPRQGSRPFTTYTDPGPADVPEVTVRPQGRGFTGSPEVPPPPDVRVRAEGGVGAPEPPSGVPPDITVNPRGTTGPRDYPPAAVVPEVTVDPRGVTGPRDYPPSGAAADVAVNPQGFVQKSSADVLNDRLNSWLPAPGDEPWRDLVRQTPQGFEMDLTGPTVVGGPGEAAPSFADVPEPTPRPTPAQTPAPTLPANLTPDELVGEYERRYPPTDEMTALLDQATPPHIRAARAAAERLKPLNNRDLQPGEFQDQLRRILGEEPF